VGERQRIKTKEQRIEMEKKEILRNKELIIIKEMRVKRK
jgi:hypothetical protein